MMVPATPYRRRHITLAGAAAAAAQRAARWRALLRPPLRIMPDWRAGYDLLPPCFSLIAACRFMARCRAVSMMMRAAPCRKMHALSLFDKRFEMSPRLSFNNGITALMPTIYFHYSRCQRRFITMPGATCMLHAEARSLPATLRLFIFIV